MKQKTGIINLINAKDYLSEIIHQIDTEYHLQHDEISDDAYNKIEKALDLLRDAHTLIIDQLNKFKNEND